MRDAHQANTSIVLNRATLRTELIVEIMVVFGVQNMVDQARGAFQVSQ